MPWPSEYTVNVMPIVRMSRSASVLAGLQLGLTEAPEVLDERGGGRARLPVLVDELVPGARERPQISHRHVIVPSGRLYRLDVPFVTGV